MLPIAEPGEDFFERIGGFAGKRIEA